MKFESKNKSTATAVAVGLALSLAATVNGANWIGGSGNPLNIWSDGANYDSGFVPSSATDRGLNDNNIVFFPTNGTTALIDNSVNATAFAVQVGHPIGGASGNQAASNTLNMTGGSLTTQGNFLMNIGRGTNDLPGQLAQFNMSGGVLNAAGITVPEAFAPSAGSVGVNAEMHVSGNAIVNTDLLRLGANDSHSVVTISDFGQINLTDDNNGFAGGVLWIEAFEATPQGTSLLDIRDNGILTIHGEWWTDEGGDGSRGAATQAEADYFQTNYVDAGWIVANGGADAVDVSFDSGVITMRVTVPEPTSGTLAILALSGMLTIRRRSA